MTPLVLDFTDPARAAWAPDGPRPLRTSLWRPAGVGSWPVVLLSHGTGGSARSLAWLAEALVDAGWAVLAVDHHGNTATQDYQPAAFVRAWERPLDLSRALDQALSLDLGLDPSRVVACGFSIGGYTAAALCGVRGLRPLFEALVSGQIPLPAVPEFPGLARELRQHWEQDPDGLLAGCEGDVSDARVRAAILLSPGIGELLDLDSLEQVQCPVLILFGGADETTPAEVNADVYAKHIPAAQHVCLGERVGHYDLLDAPTPGERTALHQLAARLTVQFLGSFAGA